MKKSLIAQSVAALTGGLGLAAAVNAAVISTPTAPAGVGQATILQVNTDGIGHINMVPYYSTQSGNDTYINITNTDVKNGKAVKVRFRAAGNSDDVYDITVLMSPGDNWSASISTDPNIGLPRLNHNDKSCTLPTNVKGPFVTTRLDSTLTPSQKAEQAGEGYVEILNMADIPPNTAATSLYRAIKHVSGVAPCTAAPLNALFNETTDGAAVEAKGLAAPTSGLMTNWTVINVPKAAAYTGAAVAIEARVAPGGLPGYGNIVFFPQAATPVDPTLVNGYTSDPLLRIVAPATTAKIAAAMFDFPDLSTPYLASNANPLQQAADLSASLAVTSVANEFVTDPSILGKTDWVFSMPTRRYSVAFDYAATTNATRAVFSDLPTDYFTSANVSVVGRQLCVSGLSTTSAIDPFTILEPVNRTGAVTADREENTLSSPSEFVISPGEPAAPLSFCGEVSVLTFNAGLLGNSVLGAKVAKKDLTVPFTDGWLRISTPGLVGVPSIPRVDPAGTTVGIPVIGNMMTELFNARSTVGTAGAYGQTFPHRGTRP